MGSEIPEWAMEAAMEALKAARPAYDSQGQYDQHWESVARALVSAERRGIERAAEIAQRDSGMASGGYNPDFGPNVARRITCAIRQLGDTP